jgi:hypothetical protein
MSSRREFLAKCSGLTAGVMMGPMRALGQPFDFLPRSSSVDQISFSELACQVNTKFRVHAATGKVVELELMQASLDPKLPQQGKKPAPDADYEKFSLIFSGPRRELLEEKALKFEHDQLGCFELLVLPVFTRKPDKVNYQAVFNRPRKPSRTRQLTDARRGGSKV